jgi:S1-C subfamily serine protease
MRIALGSAAIAVLGQAIGADEPALGSILTARTSVGPRIVRIVARGIDGRTGLGSGVPIAPDRVVTNCHVTRRASSIAIMVGAGFDAPSNAVVAQASDAEHDLCVLRTETPLPLAPVPIGSAPRVGDRVVGLGFSGGITLRVHPGEVMGLFAFHGAEVLQTSTAFNLGASGGGLFNSANELVGIMTFRGRARIGQFYSLPVAWVARVLAERPFVPVVPQIADRAFWERDPADQPMFLRANALEAMQDWTQLALLARDWIAREPDDPAGWLALGKALLHEGRLDDAPLARACGRQTLAAR